MRAEVIKFNLFLFTVILIREDEPTADSQMQRILPNDITLH